MNFHRLVAAIVAVAFLSACDDPSGVGLDLAGGQTGEPFVLVLPPATFSSANVRDITGDADLMLVGGINDPGLGEISAEMNLDVVAPTLSSEFQSGNVTEAWIDFSPTYVNGDTLAEFEFIVKEILTSWTSFGVASDTSLNVGSEIGRKASNAQAANTRIDLDPSWIAANDTLIRGTAFNQVFDGFNITTSNNDVALGFPEATSQLRIVSGGDTALFIVSQNLTTTRRIAAPNQGLGRVLLQDGLGEGIRLDIDAADPELENVILSKGVLRIFADTLGLLQGAPPNVVRPPIQQLELIVVTSEDVSIPLQVSEIDEAGVFEFGGSSLQLILQSILAEENLYSHLELSVPTLESTLGSLFLYDVTSGDSSPSLVITASKIDD